MLKEIFEQPERTENTMRGRFDDEDASAKFGGLNLSPTDLRQVSRIVLTACGTSWHAALVGEYLLEELARIPVEVEYASELGIAIRRSRTARCCLPSRRAAKQPTRWPPCAKRAQGASHAGDLQCRGQYDRPGSDGGVYSHAGLEIGVASTKAYTSQCLTPLPGAVFLAACGI